MRALHGVFTMFTGITHSFVNKEGGGPASCFMDFCSLSNAF